MDVENKSEFGIVVDVAEAYLSIASGEMEKFVNDYRPVAVKHDQERLVQVLFFEYESDEQMNAVLERAIECGLTTAKIVEHSVGNIVSFEEAKKRRKK